MIVFTIQMNLMCDCDSVGQGPGTLSQSSPRARGGLGRWQVPSVCRPSRCCHYDYFCHWCWCRYSIADASSKLACHISHGRSLGKQMLSEDESSQDQTGDGLSASTLAIQTSVLGGWSQVMFCLLSVLQSKAPRYIKEWGYRRGVLEQESSD